MGSSVSNSTDYIEKPLRVISTQAYRSHVSWHCCCFTEQRDWCWRDWCWSWNSNTLATWCEELTYLKRPCCWERLKTGGEGDDRGWDGWMASLTQWRWVWVNSGSWWWTGRPGVLQSMELQRVGHNWVTELTDCLLLCGLSHFILITYGYFGVLFK